MMIKMTPWFASSFCPIMGQVGDANRKSRTRPFPGFHRAGRLPPVSLTNGANSDHRIRHTAAVVFVGVTEVLSGNGSGEMKRVSN
jgi:hypothetical protein